MASKQEELEFRVSETAQLLEAGIKPSHVAQTICLKFSISRATAYRLIQKAEETMMLSDDGPALEEHNPLDQTAIAALITHQLVTAAAQNDFKAVAQLTKALDSVKRWSIPAQQDERMSYFQLRNKELQERLAK